MGADLFESYVGSLVSAVTLGVVAYQVEGAFFPLILAGIGIIASMIGTFFVKGKEGTDPQKSLNLGSYVAYAIVIGASLVLSNLFFGRMHEAAAIISGLAVGFIIGQATEIYTSDKYNSVKKIAEQSETGSATNIISGLAVGMKSTVVPILFIAIGIIIAYSYSRPLRNRSGGSRYAGYHRKHHRRRRLRPHRGQRRWYRRDVRSG